MSTNVLKWNVWTKRVRAVLNKVSNILVIAAIGAGQLELNFAEENLELITNYLRVGIFSINFWIKFKNEQQVLRKWLIVIVWVTFIFRPRHISTRINIANEPPSCILAISFAYLGNKQ